jgi:hypothetical protein
MNNKKSDKWSVQISKNLTEIVKDICKKEGYKVSGFIENAIISKISGSFHNK